MEAAKAVAVANNMVMSAQMYFIVATSYRKFIAKIQNFGNGTKGDMKTYSYLYAVVPVYRHYDTDTLTRLCLYMDTVVPIYRHKPGICSFLRCGYFFSVLICLTVCRSYGRAFQSIVGIVFENLAKAFGSCCVLAPSYHVANDGIFGSICLG